jgi:dTDP-4-amino-4,6-dideoxygalactose transaminase
MDGIQGAVLHVKLRHLSAWNNDRRRHAAYYTQRLECIEGIKLPTETAYSSHVYHIYPICIADRDQLMAQLENKGIHCGIHYPVPIHLQPAYRTLNLPRGTFPQAESNAQTQLSLPIYPELSSEQIDYVADSLEKCISMRK